MKFVLLLTFLSIFIALSSSKGYITCQYFPPNLPLRSLTCSDGKYGLMTRWKYGDLSKLYPYVTAFSGAKWNSPNCGKCLQITGPQATVYLTVIDVCGDAPAGHDAHFDVSQEAFIELFGSIAAGFGDVEWSYASNNLCRGNLG